MKYPLSNVALLVLCSASLFGICAQVFCANAQSEGGGTLANPLQAQSLDRLSATRDRPLFSPTRRPVPPPPPPVARVPEVIPPPPPPNVTVVGIVLDGDGARAIVRSGMGTKFERVQIGDDIGGWKVSQIEGRRLVLSLGERLATFTLFSDERGKRSPDGSDSPVASKFQDAPQQDRAQQMTPQPSESQAASPRKRRKPRE
jgi:general secretion pathway protein N